MNKIAEPAIIIACYLFLFGLASVFQIHRLNMRAVRVRNNVLDHVRGIVDQIPKSSHKEIAGALLVWGAVIEGFDATDSKPVLTEKGRVKATDMILSNIRDHAESPGHILMNLGHRQNPILPS